MEGIIEEFRVYTPIPLYSISNLGRVKNIKTNRILKPGLLSTGYHYVHLCMNKTKYKRKIHKLVAEMFLENPLNKRCVDHINNIKTDNRAINLRYATHSENGMNKSKTSKNTSGIVGVVFDKSRNKWVSRININGKEKHLGRFENIEDAAKARTEAEEIYFGEFSYNNSKKTN